MRQRPRIEDETLGGVIDLADLPAFQEAEAVESDAWLDWLPLAISMPLILIPFMAVVAAVAWALA